MHRPALLQEPLMPAGDVPLERLPVAHPTPAGPSSSFGAESTTPLRTLLACAVFQPEMQQYLQGVVTYVLSRQWKDLFAIYAFRLQPLPYCSNQLIERITCSHPAPLGVQVLFAFSLLAGAAAVARVAAAYELLWPRLRAVPAMAGMCVGWSFGDVSVELLAQLAGGVGANFLFVACETLIGAAVLAGASVARWA